jgi:type II secretory pathway predicted ATPase ExeA
MYLSHFNLQEKPFKVSTDPKFLWLGEKHQEALETLRYGILYGDGYVVLTGDVGTGKTTLAMALAKDLNDKVIVARVPYPDVEVLDFLKLISAAYGIGSDLQSKASFRDRFESFLRCSFSAGKKAVLILDEAQRMKHEHLEELIQLSSVEENGVGLLNIFFVGQNEFNDMLQEDSNRALRQRIAINYSLVPLTRTETEQYIFHRLKVVNGSREIFTAGAIQEVFLQSGGIPRLINIVCDLALLMAYLEGGSNVRAEAVKQGVKRLRLPGERPGFIAVGTEPSPAMEDHIGGELTAKMGDQIHREVMSEDAPGTARGKFLWAGGLALVVVLLGLALFFHRGEQGRKSEASIEKVSQDGGASQVGMKPSEEQGVGAMATTPSSAPSLLQGTDKVPEASAQLKASGGLAETKPSKKASVLGTRRESRKAVGSGTSVVPPRKTFPELLREEKAPRAIEKGLDERRGPPLEDGRTRRSQSPGPTTGSSVRGPSEKEAEEAEPGMAIDWILEKREKQ